MTNRGFQAELSDEPVESMTYRTSIDDEALWGAAIEMLLGPKSRVKPVVPTSTKSVVPPKKLESSPTSVGIVSADVNVSSSALNGPALTARPEAPFAPLVQTGEAATCTPSVVAATHPNPLLPRRMATDRKVRTDVTPEAALRPASDVLGLDCFIFR